MGTTRVTMTLDDSAAALLDQVSNKSGYLSRCVLERWDRWQAALETLRAHKWRAAEVKAACDVLNGIRIPASCTPGGRISAELHDGQRLNQIAEKWEVTPKRWTKLVSAVAGDDHLAAALLVTVAECFADNPAWDATVGRM